jgi:hypothetical protein
VSAEAGHDIVVIEERRKTNRRVRNIPITFEDRRKGDRREDSASALAGISRLFPDDVSTLSEHKVKQI